MTNNSFSKNKNNEYQRPRSELPKIYKNLGIDNDTPARLYKIDNK
jgi:hypothetical protein